ncbi:MAG: glycosyltransferase [Myxococcota bacterium]|nr:glycosyltransferase [Myxococcota bacterium]
MTDVVCLSRRRWGSSFDRMHQLVSRFARDRRAFVVEEPVRDAVGSHAVIEVIRGPDGLFVCTPHLPENLDDVRAHACTVALLDELVARYRIAPQVLWVSASSALRGARRWKAQLAVWDCERALGSTSGARELERDLLARADLVLTSTHAARDAARRHHAEVHCVPSGVDVAHLASGGGALGEPVDQSRIRGPRLGIAAEIDERIDLALLARIADARPELQLIVVGPAHVAPEALPFRANLHWLGEKRWQEVPRYLAEWDVALLPLAVPERRPIDPRRALEVLAAGLPLVASPTREVAAASPPAGLLRLADREAFVGAIDAALREPPAARREAVDALRAEITWDAVFARVDALVRGALQRSRVELRSDVDARTSA